MTREQWMQLEELSGELHVLQARNALTGISTPQASNIMREQEKARDEAVRRCMLNIGDIINTIKSEDLRELFRRKYLHGQSWAQIASDMPRYSGEPAAAARRMSRAKQRCMVKNKVL